MINGNQSIVSKMIAFDFEGCVVLQINGQYSDLSSSQIWHHGEIILRVIFSNDNSKHIQIIITV